MSALIGCCLVVAGIIINQCYEKINKEALLQKQAVDLRLQKENEAIEYVQRGKQQSAEVHIAKAENYIEQKKFKMALALLDSATQQYPESQKASYDRGIIYYSTGKYSEALAELNKVSGSGFSNDNLHFTKAKCYIKQGKNREAISDLKACIALGNKEAEKLYGKANPIIRKVFGYQTRCCDGSISYARGRGACSWHGGVCNWNDPIYEEHRKYPEE